MVLLFITNVEFVIEFWKIKKIFLKFFQTAIKLSEKENDLESNTLYLHN